MPASTSKVGSWFSDRYLSIDPRWMGLFRWVFGGILLMDGLRRWAHVRTFYSNDGFLPNHYSIFAPLGRNLFSIFHAASTVGEASVLFALACASFFLFTIGYRTRLFHLLSAFFITSLNSRNIFVENGGTVVVNILCIWTLFLPLGTRFSVDAVLQSLRQRPEANAADLAKPLERPVTRHVSIVVLALLLQWSVIYFFNTVHKDGRGWWPTGMALHWFWQQDRIVTWFSIFARDHETRWLVQGLTRGTLIIEGTLACVMLMPFWQTWMRRLGFLLAFGLHGGIALSARLGPFSYVMTSFFILHLGQADFELVTRWFGRASRKRTVIFDADCGFCFQCVRVLARLDPFQRLTFVGNDQPDAFPAGVDPAATERSIVVVDAQGHVHEEERAVFSILTALPLGIVLGFWLRIPGLSLAGRGLYRVVARNRLRISTWLGHGACGLPLAAPAAAPSATPAGTAEARTLRGDLLGVSGFLREVAVAVLIVVSAVQVANDNGWLKRSHPVTLFGKRFVIPPARVPEPEWMHIVVSYPRILQGWGMFAPEPPYEDGRVVIDARSPDGTKFDPFTGKEPDFDPYTATGWGHNQFWCDYHNRIRFPGYQHFRPFLKDYLLRQHLYTGLPQVMSFDVWWVQDKSPPFGVVRGEPLIPEKLLSHGFVRDSGATPWLQPKGGAR